MTTSVRLYQGDCREWLKEISPVDTVITDPVWPNCPPELLEGWQDPAALLREALELIQARRLVIVTRYDSDPRFLQAVPARWPFFRVQVLRYAVPGYNGRKLGGMEFAYCFGEPVPSAPGRRVIPGEGPIVTRRTPENGHPAPRALEHFRWLVNWWSEPGETVLDPFCGSGTTAVAAYQLGRHFVGGDIEPRYIEITKRRIVQAQTQPLLWEAA